MGQSQSQSASVPVSFVSAVETILSGFLKSPEGAEYRDSLISTVIDQYLSNHSSSVTAKTLAPRVSEEVLSGSGAGLKQPFRPVLDAINISEAAREDRAPLGEPLLLEGFQLAVGRLIVHSIEVERSKGGEEFAGEEIKKTIEGMKFEFV
jgi:hypothetical protein